MVLPRRLSAVVLMAILLLAGIPAAGEPASPEGSQRTPAQRALGVTVPLQSNVSDTLRALDWNPADGTALIVGDNGTVLKYNLSTGFTGLQQDNNFSFYSVAFRPLNTSTLALLVGEELMPFPPNPSVVMLYDGSAFTRLSSTAYRDLKSVAWSADASKAYITGQKGNDGVIIKYQAGALSEVLVDTVDALYGMCRGDGGYYVYGFDFDLQATSLRFFDGTSFVRNVTLPAQNDYSPEDIEWSGAKGMGLMAGFSANLLRFNSTGATKLQDAALKGELSGVGWAPSGGRALVTGWDNAAPVNPGLLYSCDGTAISSEYIAAEALTDAAWNPSGKYALVTGENGTVLRYSLANTRPTCSITDPLSGAVVNGTVTVKGTAFDVDGDPITSVWFKVDSGDWILATGGENWSIDWDTTTYTNDRHYLYAKSSDGMDESVSDTRMVFVGNPNHAPEVTIDQPADSATVSGNVVVSGNATDSDVGDSITSVWVRLDDGDWTAATGTSSWSYTWASASAQDGPHTIKARASDGEANSSDDSISVTLQNHGPNFPPTVTITSPTSGATVVGQVQVQGTAADSDQGVVAVYMRIDGGTWQAASGTTSWSYMWDTGPVGGGSHTIYARAYDGIINSSDAKITVTVNHIPSCAITNPASGAVLTGEVTITGTASDPDNLDSITTVQVRIDTGDWVKASGTNSWNYKWNTSSASAGQHTLYARASDGKSDSAEASRSVTVEKPPAAVTLSNPSDYGENYVVLEWTRNLDTDFARYEVFKSEAENSPLSGLSPNVIPSQSVTTFNVSSLKSRTTYWFRVRVVDTTGLMAVSNEVYATTLRENTPPIAKITSSRMTAYVGDSITFNADGSYDPDRGGRVVRFEWDFEGRGRFPIDTRTLATQKHEFTKPGKYMIQVRVTDERGATGIDSINITIIEKPKGGIDPAVYGGIALVILLVAAVGGYLYFRSRTPPPPPEEETYYEDEVRQPARLRRKQVWDGEQAPRRPVKQQKVRRAQVWDEEVSRKPVRKAVKRPR